MSSGMEFLRQEIEDLKKLGESWNMEKYQIEEAIMKALQDKNGNLPAEVQQDVSEESKESKRSLFKSVFLVCCVLSVGGLLTFAVGANLYAKYSPFEMYMNRVVGELQYPVLRAWRLWSLPLHRYFDLEPYAARECLIDNPWYEAEEPDCDACEDVMDVERVENITDFNNVYAGWGSPIIVTDVQPYATNTYTIESFMANYQQHRATMDADLCEVSSLDESINTIGEYYEVLKKLGPEAPNIRWKICYGEGLRALRKVFPKPYFVSTEGGLEKYLMIVGWHNEVLPVPAGQYGNAWLAQVTGASEIQLRPIEACNTTCSNINFTLNKGEVLYLNQEFWEADIVGNPTEEPAVSFISCFA